MPLLCYINQPDALTHRTDFKQVGHISLKKKKKQQLLYELKTSRSIIKQLKSVQNTVWTPKIQFLFFIIFLFFHFIHFYFFNFKLFAIIPLNHQVVHSETQLQQ